jgi:hypothetical protein
VSSSFGRRAFRVGWYAAQGTEGKCVSNFLLIAFAFSPVKPPPAARSEIALK